MNSLVRRRSAVSALLLAIVALLVVPRMKADDWQPIAPEDLKMTSHPGAPGASAIILYRLYESDDNESTEYTYKRIKIFSEEGKKYANVEIPYDRGFWHVVDLKGRTIHPDGSIVNFDGKTYDKMVYKQGKTKYQVKTFNLPDVQVGSIIEYKYKLRYEEGYAIAPEWIVQDELYERQAKFRYTPYKGQVLGSRAFAGTRVQWSISLPKGVEPKPKGNQQGSVIELEMSDIPAFIEEPFMPPASALHQRVRFFYFDGDLKGPDEYWNRYGREWSSGVEKFAGQRKYAQQVAAEAAGSESDSEQKLRKVYARVQQVRNLTYERGLSKEEMQKLSLKEGKGADDVLKQNAGYGYQIARAFLAMVRAQGFDASMAIVTDREKVFFEQNIPDMGQLTHELVVVNLKGKEIFLDPGTRFAPFGVLRWRYSASRGMRQAKKDVTFVTTPPPDAADNATQRVADLTLSPTGDLKGKLTLTFSGQDALSRRLGALETDEAGRNKDLEDEVKYWMPTGAVVKMESASGWTNSAEPLTATLSIDSPGFATGAGKRMVMPTGIFQSSSKALFPHAERNQAIYFPYPYSEKDDVKVTLPAGMQVEALPGNAGISVNYVDYNWDRSKAANTLTLKRNFMLKMNGFRKEDYGAIKNFFDILKSTDDGQAILRVTSNAAGQ
jgi:hypothetical protein